MARLLVVGELCADIVVEIDSPPVFDQTESLVRRTTVTLGSSSAITACGAARLGVPTAMVGVLGADLFGDFVRAELQRREVDVSRCRVDDTTPTGSSTILTLPGGDRSILTAIGSIGAVTTRDVPVEMVEAVAHVHVGAYFLQYGLQPTLADWFGEQRAAGRTTSLDPNFDPAEVWDAGVADVLAETDVLFCNEQEAMALARASTAGWGLTWLLDRMPGGATVVLKRGPRGASAHWTVQGERHQEVAMPRPVRGDVVDTVGAGDSLSAGFLAARLRGLDPVASLAAGVTNGTASTRAAGGTGGQLDWSTLAGLAGL